MEIERMADCQKCGAELNIKTSFVNPPIPIRHFDWVAWIDGQEESGPYGHGATEAEARVDLSDNLSVDEIGLHTYGTNHGVDCCKVPHGIKEEGFLHSAEDDSPFFVDNIKYCGRCHQML